MADEYLTEARINRIKAGTGMGRPRDEEKVLDEIVAAMGLLPEAKPIKKVGRRLKVDISDDDLEALVAAIYARTAAAVGKTGRRATLRSVYWVAARLYLNLGPNTAAHRLRSEVPPVADNIERRIQRIRTQARKLSKNSPD